MLRLSAITATTLLALAAPLAFVSAAAPRSAAQQQETEVNTVMRGRCSGSARWRLVVNQAPASDQRTTILSVRNARPGSRWDYSDRMTLGDQSSTDEARLTARADGRWEASHVWFVAGAAALRGRTLATSLAGQQCVIHTRQKLTSSATS